MCVCVMMCPRSSLLIYLSIDVLNVAAVTQLHRWENILMFLQEIFYDDENIWLRFNRSPPSLPFLSLFLFPFSIRQQSLEWSPHPCKGVNARLRVCVYVCNCVREEPSTVAPIPVEDFGASHTPVRDGSSCPSLKEQTQLRPFLTQKQLRKNVKKKNKTVCKEISCLDFVHLDAFIGKRPHLHYKSPWTQEVYLFWRDSTSSLEWLLICFSFSATINVW